MSVFAISKSTDKLSIICETINDKLMSDDVLKQRVKYIGINWIELKLDGDSQAFPNLDIQFKD